MRRLLATIRCDITLQIRHGFYYATVFVLAVCVALVSRIPALDLKWLLPALVLGNLLLNTFYFIGGLILLEKSDGTLEAQVVTPLRAWEYLISKIGTLALLGLIENFVIVLLLAGSGFDPLPLLLSLTLTATIYCLAGIVVVVRYASINEYLMPSVIYTSLLMVPLMPYLARWHSWLLYLHPMQAPLELAKAAFQPLPHWQIVYGALYALFWIVPLSYWAHRAFRRFVVAGEE
jgi:fluoroquinolone transport system permease protein